MVLFVTHHFVTLLSNSVAEVLEVTNSNLIPTNSHFPFHLPNLLLTFVSENN